MRKGKKLSDIKDEGNGSLKLCWHRGIPNIMFRDVGELTVRLVSDIWEVNRHWITSHKARKNVYQWCTSYDPTTGAKNAEIRCASCEANIRDDIQLAVNVIVRNYKEDGGRPAVRVLLIPKYMHPRLLKLQDKNKADLNSVKKGCDLFIEYDPSAKNKWSIDKGDVSPLTEEEKELISAFPTLDSLIPDFNNEDELIPYYDQAKAFLASQYYFVRQTKSYVDVDAPWSSFKYDINGTLWSEFPELVAYEQDKYKDTRLRKGGCPTTEADRKSFEDRDKKGRFNDSSSTDSSLDDAFGGSSNKKERPAAAAVSTKKKKKVKKKKVAPVKNPECFGEYDGSAECLSCSVRKTCSLETEGFDA